MSTGLLYHAFGIRGYHYTRTDYQDGQTIFTIRQEPETCRCSACGSPRLNFRGRVERRFRTVPIGRRATFVVLPIPRVECQACGVVRQVKIPFADPRRSSTNSFERYALELGRRMTIRDVALHLGVSWDVIKDIQKRDLARRFAKPKLLRRLAIDEIAIAKGHRSLTVVLDLDSGAVVFVGDGKGAKALKPFWKRLKGSKAKIEAVAMDMSPAYREAVSTHLPKAKIVFDRFHVMKLFNEKLSDLRRALYREATDGMQKQVLKGTRWLLLKSAENLDEERDEKKKLEEALALNRSLAVAYYLKEDLRQFWEQPGKKFATLGNRTKINSPLTCLRSDYHTPLGKSLGALQTGLVPLHLLLAHTPPTLILLLDQLHFRLLPLPCHRPRPTQHCLHTRQQRPVPVHLQDPPTSLDRIVLAVIGRIVHQLDHQTEPVRELHQPPDELRPPTRRLRAVVQIDHQSLHTREIPAPLLPPALQAVHHEVTRQTCRPEQDGQQTPHDLQDSKGDQRRLRLHVVVQRLHGFLAPGRTIAGELPDLHFGLRVDRDPERVLRTRRPLMDLFDRSKDRLGLLDLLEGFGLLHATQAVAQTVEEIGFFRF